MSARGILDVDMHTLGRWILQGWHWWLEELRDLLPAQLRRSRRDDLPCLIFDGGRLEQIGSHDRRASAEPKRGARVTIAVPARLCLSRTIERPATSERDVQRMLAFEGDTLLPFPSGSTIVAGRKVGAVVAGRMQIDVAGLPIDTARHIVGAADAAGVRPVRVALQGQGASAVVLDFAPAMREAGILPRAQSATPLIWAVVGLLVAVNLAMLIWRDAASVDRLAQIVQEQQPAVLVAQAITRRADQDRALMAKALALRTGHDALGGLATVSRTLPEGAWLQRYVWDGSTVRLTGYKPPKIDVASALRRSGNFSDVRSMADEMQATVPAGDPFDLTARIIGK